MARDKSEEIRKRAEKLEAESAKRREKAAKEFSKEVGAISDSVNDLSKNAEKIIKSLGRTSDLKEKAKALEKLNDMMSSLESQSETLSSGLSSLGSSMKQTDREIAEITSDSAYSILRNLRNIVSEENRKIERETKSAEETLREARQASRQSSEMYRLSQEKSLSQLRKSVQSELNIRKNLESDIKKLLNASSKWEREYYQNRVNSGREKLSELHNIIERSMDYLDEIPEGMEETVREMRDESEELNKIYDNIRNDIDETLNDGIYSSVKEFCHNTREIISSMELDSILQSMGDQVDNFIETRRQILARTGSSFDKEGFSDAVSEALGNVSYTMSRNEMADAYKDFIKSTRIQNSAMIKDYISDIAAMEKVYGVNADNLNKLLWQDANSGAGGKMMRSLSNVAAELENNGELYTSADSILSAINDKAELIYGIARGDVKRQKTMLKSVAAIQAIQETSANAGVSDVTEAISELSSLATIYDYQENEKAQSLAIATQMSFEELRDAVQQDPTIILNRLHERTKDMTEEELYAFTKNYGVVFSSTASTMAFASQSAEDLLKTNEEVRKSLQGGDQSESALAVGKAKELTSLTDEIGNKFSDNPAVKLIADTLGEFDVNVANLAHYSIIATNGADAAGRLFDFLSKDGIPKLASVVRGVGPFISSTVAPMMSSAMSFIGTGLSSMSGILSTGASTLGSILSTLGPIALTITGIFMSIKDMIGGYGKREEWLGEEDGNTLWGKASSIVGGFLGGTGKGVGEEGASFGDVAENTGFNAVKGAGIGAGIGTFLLPGLGTAAGAAIGGGIGALLGLIGGKRVAQAANATGKVSVLGAFDEGLSKVPRDGYAFIHEGEAILTEDQAGSVRADGGLPELLSVGGPNSTLESIGRNIALVAYHTGSLESDTAYLAKGFKDYTEEEYIQRESTTKFQKALKRKFGLDITGGMKGTSGSGGGGGSFGGSSGGYYGGRSGGSTPSLRGASSIPGKISDFGDMSDMNEAEKKAWRVAMQIGADLGLPPEMFYAQIINESGRDYDWHYQENNLAGVKYAGQAGAHEIPGGSDDGGNYAGWNTEAGYAHYFSGTLMAQDNFAPAIAAAQEAKARGESLDRIIEAYVRGIHEGGYFSGDLDTYIRNVKSIAKEAPTGYKYGSGSAPSVLDTKNELGFNRLQILKQYDDEWADHAYDWNTVAGAGCGPTSFAMIARGLGYNISPADAADFASANGHHVEGGTSSAFFDDYLSTLSGGKQGFRQATSREDIKAALEAGIPVIAAHGEGMFTNNGHFVTYAGIDKQGNLIVNDPNEGGGVNNRGDDFKYDLERVLDDLEQDGGYALIPTGVTAEDFGNNNAMAVLPNNVVDVPQKPSPLSPVSYNPEDYGGMGGGFGSPLPQATDVQNDVSRIAQNVDGNINVHDVVEAINYATTSIVGKLDAVIGAISSISINLPASPYGGGGGGFEPKPVMDSTTGYISSL